MKGIAGIDEISLLSSMLVGQESSSNNLDVLNPSSVDLGPQHLEHHRGDIYGDHPGTEARYRKGELSGPSPNVDDYGLIAETKLLAQQDLTRGVGVLLRVVMSDMLGIEVLSTSVAD